MVFEILLFSSIMLQPVAHDDVLEPSVLNELDHALVRAPKQASYIPQALVPKALESIGVSEKMSNTDVAIKIISTQQRDGRWTDKNGSDISFAAIEVLRALSPDEKLVGERIAALAQIENFSKKHDLSFAEGAARFRKLGFRKIELSYPVEGAKIDLLKNLSFSMPVLVWMRTGREFPRRECLEDALRVAKKVNAQEVHLVVGPLVEAGLRENSLFSEIASLAADNGIAFKKTSVQH